MFKSIAKRIALFALIGASALAAGCGSRDDSVRIAFIGNTETGEYSEVCQEVWQGVSAYATESGTEASIYAPGDSSSYSARITMLNAIEEGADVVVCVGKEMANAVYDLQQKENETEFVLIDGVPTDGSGSGKTRIRGNTCSIVFNRQEAGFLAGYAAVREGYRKIGFLGGSASEEDRLYGSGFIQGAEAAGKDMGYTDGEVEIRYRLTTSNAISPAMVSEIGEWFQEGCELISVCGSGPEFIGPESALLYGGKVIVADINKLDDSDSIIAASGINHVTVAQLALRGLAEGSLKGGKKTVFGIAEGGVTMHLAEGQFQSFTEEELAALTEKIASGEIRISDSDVAQNPERYEITVCRISGLESEENTDGAVTESTESEQQE